MLKSLFPIFTLFAIFCSTTVATAEYISINGVDGSYDMYAGDFNGILGSNDHQFSMSDLDILSETLNNDGIETMGRLSFILASTDAGISLVGLFDGVPINNPK